MENTEKSEENIDNPKPKEDKKLYTVGELSEMYYEDQLSGALRVLRERRLKREQKLKEKAEKDKEKKQE